MGTVGAGFSMSLDGCIAGPGDDGGRLFEWMFSGDTDITLSTQAGTQLVKACHQHLIYRRS